MTYKLAFGQNYGKKINNFTQLIGNQYPFFAKSEYIIVAQLTVSMPVWLKKLKKKFQNHTPVARLGARHTPRHPPKPCKLLIFK